MKPSWDDHPPEAMWLAMDGDGFWHWFEHEPVWEPDDGQWAVTEDGSRYWYAGDSTDADDIELGYAYDTLEPRP